MSITRRLAIVALPLLAVGCSDPSGPSSVSPVAVRFGTPSTSTTASSSLVRPSAARAAWPGAGEGLAITGSNGTLTVTGVSFIVSELELECEGDDDAPATAPACVEFEAPPAFVRLPLASGAVDAASAAIPAGSYTELEFEVENLEIDEDDDSAKRQQISDLLAAIRGQYGDFPDRASMVVEGTFTPSGGSEGTPFRVYFDAEIEVEMRLQPPLTVSEAGVSRALTVDVQPALWFRRADGTVMDLSALDFTATGAVVEFELEMDRGFTRVEFDD